MSKQEGKRRRARYTLEFKLEAVRLVKGGQDAAVTARVLDIPKATLGNWIRAAEKGELQGAGDRPVSAEQMELARLRAELARVKMERDILKKGFVRRICGPVLALEACQARDTGRVQRSGRSCSHTLFS